MRLHFFHRPHHVLHIVRSRHHNKNVSWLRKTEYISTEYNRFTQTAHMAEARYSRCLLWNIWSCFTAHSWSIQVQKLQSAPIEKSSTYLLIADSFWHFLLTTVWTYPLFCLGCTYTYRIEIISVHLSCYSDFLCHCWLLYKVIDTCLYICITVGPLFSMHM